MKKCHLVSSNQKKIFFKIKKGYNEPALAKILYKNRNQIKKDIDNFPIFKEVFLKKFSKYASKKNKKT